MLQVHPGQAGCGVLCLPCTLSWLSPCMLKGTFHFAKWLKAACRCSGGMLGHACVPASLLPCIAGGSGQNKAISVKLSCPQLIIPGGSSLLPTGRQNTMGGRGGSCISSRPPGAACQLHVEPCTGAD